MASETKTVEKPEVDAYIDELRGRMARKQELREKNLTAEQHRPDESFFRKLDSNLKKNTAFIKKLKTLTESQRTALINDFGALNLTKYVEEMASSLVEVKLKVTDVPCAIELCCLAHQRYARFADVMLEQWRKALPQKKTDKVANASKLRVDLRMFGELVVLGLFVEKDGLQVLGNALAFLIQTDKTEHQNVAVLTTFIRYCGEDYAGLAPRSIRMAADRLGLTLPKSTIFSAERRQTVGNLLAEYYDSLVKHVLNDHSEKKIQERRNRRQYDTKGEVQPDARQRLEEMRANFEKLLQSAQQMAEYLDKDPPAVPDDQPDEDDLLMDENGVVIQ
uniref:MIF4G domain-containing protein n=1 Tax=Plectus sambesii TaxID=2011161 RepID=A0A914V1T3_9BILA